MIRLSLEGKTKICLVIPSLQAGGMERVMSELASWFVKQQRLEIHLVLYGINREIFYSISPGISIHKPSFPFNNKFRLISTLRTLIFLRKEIRQINPDTILSFGELWNSFVLLSLFGLKYPVFVSDRSEPTKSLGKLHDFLRKKLYPRATGVIAQTSKAKEVYVQLYGHNNIEVIGNPIREISSAALPREKTVLMVGRYIRSKNQDKLIELFSKINLPDWKLVLVGYDHLKQQNQVRLEKLIVDLEMQEKVILAGKREDVDQLYANSRIFAFTSTSEGFPNVIGEAMSAGLPVVSFDCMAGPSEMVENNRTGFLVPVHDYQSFRIKLEELMSDFGRQQQMGKAGREKIKEFSLDRIAEKYLKFITKY